MQRYAATNEVIVAIAIETQSTGSAALIRSVNVRVVAATIVGIARRKENRAAATRENPKHRAQVMVMPEREVPGINASTCATPISIAYDAVRLESCLVRWPKRSANNSSNPKRRVDVPMSITDRKWVATKLLHNQPTITIGMVAITKQ